MPVWRFSKIGCGIKTATNFHSYFTKFNPPIKEKKPEKMTSGGDEAPA